MPRRVVLRIIVRKLGVDEPIQTILKNIKFAATCSRTFFLAIEKIPQLVG